MELKTKFYSYTKNLFLAKILTETHGRMQLARLKLAIRVKQKLVIIT
jgi:hypothetical protein